MSGSLEEFTLFDKCYSELDEAAKELLIRASVFGEAVSVEALRWMMGDDKEPSPPVDQPLEMLLECGLMSKSDEVDGTLYIVHTMVRVFVNQEELHRTDSDMLFVRVAQYYQNKNKVSHNLRHLLLAGIITFELPNGPIEPVRRIKWAICAIRPLILLSVRVSLWLAGDTMSWP